MKPRHFIALLLLIVPAGLGAQLSTDTFDSGQDGWLDRSAGNMTVTHDPLNGYGGLGSLRGSFASQALAFVQTDAFRATNTTYGGAFTGDYLATNARSLTFDFKADATLPSDLYIRMNGNGSLFFYSVGAQITALGAWKSIVVPLDYAFGWVGGSQTAFSNMLSDVQFVDVQITRNGTSAQNYWMDNFTLSANALSLVPEPGTGFLALAGVALLFSRRRIRRWLRSQPASLTRR